VNIYTLDIGIMVLGSLLLILITWRLGRLRERRLDAEQNQLLEGWQGFLDEWGSTAPMYKAEEEWRLEAAYLEGRRRDAFKLGRARLLTAARIFLVLNLATTLLVVIPMLFAAVNLLQKHPQQALNFNLVALALLLVTKGGLFLFTFVIVPIFKRLPPLVFGLYAKTWWEKRHMPKDPPTSKPAA
jgi:hypothetical protein